MSLSTAKYDLKNFKNVYEPSEDSFLLIDALEADIEFIKSLNPTHVIEVGSGSGVVITTLASVLKNSAFFTTDININACEATLKTASLNNSSIQVCCMDLLTSFKPNLFDIVLFNPPYVVTSGDEVEGDGLNRAWAGGADGREVINEFLELIPYMLSPDGVLYLLLLKENKPNEIIRFLYNLGFTYEVIKERKIPGEYLYVIKFCK